MTKSSRAWRMFCLATTSLRYGRPQLNFTPIRAEQPKEPTDGQP